MGAQVAITLLTIDGEFRLFAGVHGDDDLKGRVGVLSSLCHAVSVSVAEVIQPGLTVRFLGTEQTCSRQYWM